MLSHARRDSRDMDAEHATFSLPEGLLSPALLPPTSSASATTALKRACDACHKRKVKCRGDGARSCRNCVQAGLSCTYNAVPQKKGPKGHRAKVIAELRETQRQSQWASSQPQQQQHHQLVRHPSAPGSPESMEKSGLVSTELAVACVDFYFLHLYPTQPILHRRRVGETIGLMETNAEAYCLIASLCAYVLIQPNMTLPPMSGVDPEDLELSNLQLGQMLSNEARRVRKTLDHIESPTVWSVITSFFLFGCHFGLNKHNVAWFHLREATTLAHLLGMNDEATYARLDVVESSRRRRLYWLLFVTERAYALQQHKPLTLHSTIELPQLGEDPSETVELTGFLHLVALYRPFDDTFVGLWNKTRTGCTTGWLAQLQQQLTDSLPAYLHSTETQAVDLRCSRQWLHTMVWQLSISHGFLSSAAADGAMSLKYPFDISRDLVAAAARFSRQGMEVHGIGLIEKLFDVACTLTDVMTYVSPESSSPSSSAAASSTTTFAFGPRDYLDQLTKLIASLRGGRQRYMPLLMTKIGDSLPALAATMTYPLAISPTPPTAPVPLALARDDSSSFSEDPSSTSCSAAASLCNSASSVSTSGTSTPYHVVGAGSGSPPPPPRRTTATTKPVPPGGVHAFAPPFGSYRAPSSHPPMARSAAAEFHPPMMPLAAMTRLGFDAVPSVVVGGGAESLMEDPLVAFLDGGGGVGGSFHSEG